MTMTDDRVELAEYARILWKRKWMILLPTLVVLGTALVALQFLKPMYVSSTVLEIKERDIVEDAVKEFAGERQQQRREKGYENQRLKIIRQDIMSESFLEGVGKRLGLHEDPGILAAARQRQERAPHKSLDELTVSVYTGRLRDQIEVGRGGIEQFRFQAESEDPRQAYEVAKALGDAYEAFAISQSSAQTERVEEEISRLLAEERKRLQVAEAAYQEFYNKLIVRGVLGTNPITNSTLPEARRLLSEADFEATSIRTRIQRSLERLPSDMRNAASLERRVSSSRLNTLASRLAQAEREHVPILIGGGAGANVSTLRQDIFSEMSSLVAQAFPNQDGRTLGTIGDVVFDGIVLKSVQARKDQVNRYIGGFTSREKQSSGDQLTLDRLEEEKNQARQNVRQFESELNDINLKKETGEATIAAKVSVVVDPEIPSKPDSPNRLRILLLALTAGPLLGLGVVILTEYLDTSLKTVEQVEEVLELPVLGTIPKLVAANTQSSSRRRRHVGAASLILFASLCSVAAHDFPDGGSATHQSTEAHHG